MVVAAVDNEWSISEMMALEALIRAVCICEVDCVLAILK
jgi:hypothetical protein